MRMDEVTSAWFPYCGKEFARSLNGLSLATVSQWPDMAEQIVAGDPVICDLPPHEITGKYAKKHNSELGFSWW
jgi:hypothetical protein